VPDVLLVDDQPAFGAIHHQAFGPAADWCTSTAQLAEALKTGRRWTTAFVDFELGRHQPTGLTALSLLADYPETRTVVYTTLGENGRTLFATAAYSWFGCSTILDKSHGDATTLRAAAAGHNPTPEAWRERLRQGPHLVDDLFQEPSWAALWRVWPEVNGSIKAAREALPGHSDNSIRQFSKRALEAMENFRDTFLGPRTLTVSRGNTARATPLATFADSQDHFFKAPDLERALRHGQPWGRRQ
jgi:ActR/RegA family two-component response regulator